MGGKHFTNLGKYEQMLLQGIVSKSVKTRMNLAYCNKRNMKVLVNGSKMT